MSAAPVISPPIVLGENCFLRTARKEHRCFGHHNGQGTVGCGTPIFKGSKYVEYVGESAAYESGHRFHVDCARSQGLVSDAPAEKAPAGGHTPGPWRIDGQADEKGNWKVVDDGGCWVARVHFRDTIPSATRASIANAQLIAAAPEMFDLLQSLHQRFMDGRNSVGRPTLETWAEEIDDVLTRAEGSTGEGPR